MNKEIWKNFYDNYSVSNFGRVKNDKTNKIRTPFVDYRGYQQVVIKNKHFKIHRIVALNFIENKNNLPQINHKDGNKLNNHYSNLEFCNGSYNLKHAYKNGLKKPSKIKHITKKIIQKDKRGNIIKEWNSASEAGNFLNICPSHIYECCNNKRKTSKNFCWEYMKENNNERI